MSNSNSNRLRGEKALSFHGRPYINQPIKFHLLEIVQPQKPDSEHALDFLRVSTFACSRNKHSCLLSITECPQGHYGLVLHAVNLSIWQPVLWLLWWRFNWIFWVIIKTGGVGKDTIQPLFILSSLCNLFTDI